MDRLPTIHPLRMNELPESYRMQVLRYPQWTFFYLTEGEVLIEVPEHNILVGAGQLLLVPEGLPITLRHASGCQGFEGSFRLEQLKDSSYGILRSALPLQQSFWFDDAVFLGQLLQRLSTAREDADEAFLRSGLDLVLSQIRPQKNVAAIPDAFLQLVFDRKHLDLSVSDYAAQLGVSPNYLNKTVKHHTRRTAIDWIELARLEAAREWLKDPAIPISEVAARTGFEDPSYFARFFKKKTGTPPSRFRKNS